MRRPATSHLPLATFLIGLLSVLSNAPANAQPGLMGLPADHPGEAAVLPATAGPVEPRLHQAIRSCGKKWVKRAKRLTSDQLGWMLQKHHGIYTVYVADRPALTIEMLSTPSYRSCDVATHWDRRETTVRLTYSFPDGASKVKQLNYSSDDIFFDSEPRVFAHLGKALLRGINVDGEPVSRWIDVSPLKAIYEQARVDLARELRAAAQIALAAEGPSGH